MKRIISCVLAVCIMLSVLPTNSFALSVFNVENENSLVDAEGRKLAFELVEIEDNIYRMDYYVDNVLTKSYKIVPNSHIEELNISENASLSVNNITPIPTAIASEEPAALYGPTRWTHLGYIHYAYSSTFKCESTSAVSSRTISSNKSTYRVESDTTKSFSKAVSTVAAVLISLGLGPLYEAASITIEVVAQQIVMAILTDLEISVIGDTISNFFSKSFDCIETQYEIHAQVTGSGFSSTDPVSYTSTEYDVTYEAGYHEPAYKGYTPGNWQCRDFAKKVWDDSVPFWPAFPGIVGFPYGYPL